MRRVDAAQQVDAINAVPIGRRKVPERKPEFPGAHTSGIDDMLNAVQRVLDALGSRLDVRVVGYIGYDADAGCLPGCRDFAGLPIGLVALINQADTAALACELLGDRQTNAAGPADDNRDVAVEDRK